MSEMDSNPDPVRAVTRSAKPLSKTVEQEDSNADSEMPLAELNALEDALMADHEGDDPELQEYVQSISIVTQGLT